MSRIVTDTLVANLSSYVLNDSQYYSTSNLTNAYSVLSDTSSYAQIYPTRGANAETWFYFKFDTSSIPNGSTINSVGCKSRQYLSANTNNIVSRYFCMSSGTTEKGSHYTTFGNSNAIRTLTVGTWTLEELRDARLKYYVKRGTGNVNTSYPFRVYCAELTVGYSYTLYAITVSSSVSGVTINSQDSEVIGTYGTTITISGTLPEGVVITDNGVDVTNLISGSGTTHTYTINGVIEDHTVIVSAPSTGQEIFVKQNGSWVAVDTVYVKQSGMWKEVETLSIKQSGSWVS